MSKWVEYYDQFKTATDAEQFARMAYATKLVSKRTENRLQLLIDLAKIARGTL